MKQNKPGSRCATCPRWDRWHIRIPNPKDQQKLIELYRRSGAKTKSDFLRARLLDESFKVITMDKSSELYPRALGNIIPKSDSLTTKLSRRSIANAVKKTAQRMVHQLEICSAAITKLQVQAIQLTDALEKKSKIKYLRLSFEEIFQERLALF